MRFTRWAWTGRGVTLGVWVALGCGVGPGLAHAQTFAGVPAGTLDALRAMTQSAEVIFAGRVGAIRRHGEVVEVDFTVEDAVRGVSGGAYTLREWAGLWDAGNEPLRVGMRYLMLLHGAGHAGLSSPVGGSDGAIPIAGGGMVATDSPAQGDGRVVDLRWVATRVERAVPYGAEGDGRAGSVRVAVSPETRAAHVEVTPAIDAKNVSAGGVQYADVVNLLRGWERDAAR